MKKVKLFLAGLLVVPTLALGATAVMTAPAYAQVDRGVTDSQGDNVPSEIDGSSGLIKQVINILLYIIGVVAVIMLIIGGIRYTVSNGDSNQVSSAKNTILYAVVGLVVAIFAYAIVNFVVTRIGSS